MGLLGLAEECENQAKFEYSIPVQAASTQARSQAYVSGVAKLSQRSHVVRSLRAYFILHVTKIKWIMCVQKKTELSSTSQRSG